MKEQSTSASAAGCRLLRFGAVALIVGAVVMLCASAAALYLWKVSGKNVSVNRGLYSSYCSAPSITDTVSQMNLRKVLGCFWWEMKPKEITKSSHSKNFLLKEVHFLEIEMFMLFNCSIAFLLQSTIQTNYMLSRCVKASPDVLCSILSVLKLHRISTGEATLTITVQGKLFSLSILLLLCLIQCGLHNLTNQSL